MLVTAVLILCVFQVLGQTEAVRYIKTTYPYNDAVKEAKVLYFNAQHGIDSQGRWNKDDFYQGTIYRHNRRGQLIEDRHFKRDEEEVVTNMHSIYRYTYNSDLLTDLFQVDIHRSDTHTTTYLYDSLNRLISKEVQRIRSAGDLAKHVITSFEYDDLGRLRIQSDTMKRTREIQKKRLSYDTLGYKKCETIFEGNIGSTWWTKKTETFTGDSILSGNRTLTYENGRRVKKEDIAEFDKKKKLLREYTYRYRRPNMFSEDNPGIDTTLIRDIRYSYNSRGDVIHYRSLKEAVAIDYKYNSKGQLIERHGKGYVKHDEWFKYDKNGHLVEYIEHWDGKPMGMVKYSEFDSHGNPALSKSYTNKGQLSHIKWLEISYWD